MRVFYNAPVISKPAISLFFLTLMQNMRRIRYNETHAYIQLPATSFFCVALPCCFQHYRCVEKHVSVYFVTHWWFFIHANVFLYTYWILLITHPCVCLPIWLNKITHWFVNLTFGWASFSRACAWSYHEIVDTHCYWVRCVEVCVGRTDRCVEISWD